MNNILKQFAVSDTSLKQSRFKAAVLRLTFAYVLGIFCILLASSVAIYILSTTAFPITPHLIDRDKTEEGILHEEFNLYEFREHLVNVLLVVDITILVISGIISHLFARRTLRPIENLYLQQEQFIGDIAHELRTPLSILKAGTQSILNKNRTIPEYIIFLNELEEETDRLTRLSNDLLTLLQHQNAPGETFTMINLSELAQKQVQNFQAYAIEKSITLVLEKSSVINVLGLSDSLVRLLQNLIKNAIDYTPAGGAVTISLKHEDDFVTLQVSDTGIGIATEKQARIFDRFYKADSARSSTGTGLGLAIVQEIVKVHNGKIALKSTLDRGTIISVSLPDSK